MVKKPTHRPASSLGVPAKVPQHPGIPPMPKPPLAAQASAATPGPCHTPPAHSRPAHPFQVQTTRCRPVAHGLPQHRQPNAMQAQVAPKPRPLAPHVQAALATVQAKTVSKSQRGQTKLGPTKQPPSVDVRPAAIQPYIAKGSTVYYPDSTQFTQNQSSANFERAIKVLGSPARAQRNPNAGIFEVTSAVATTWNSFATTQAGYAAKAMGQPTGGKNQKKVKAQFEDPTTVYYYSTNSNIQDLQADFTLPLMTFENIAEADSAPLPVNVNDQTLAAAKCVIESLEDMGLHVPGTNSGTVAQWHTYSQGLGLDYRQDNHYIVRTPKKPITQILNFPAKLLLAKFPICARPVTASSCIPLAFQELVPGWPPAPRYPTSQAPLRVHRHADGSVRVSLAPHGSDLTFHPPLGWYWLNRSCNHFSQL